LSSPKGTELTPSGDWFVLPEQRGAVVRPPTSTVGVGVAGQSYRRAVVREVLLSPDGRLDAAHLLGFLGAHAVPGVEQWDGVRFARSLRSPSGAAAVIELRPASAGAIAVRLHGAEVDDAGLLPLVRSLTGVDDDSSAAEAALAGDPMLASLVAGRPGLRLPGSVDHAETVVRTVVGQQISLARARGATGRLVEMAGEPLPAHLSAVVPGVTHLFPLPAALARLDADALPMPRSRGRCVVALGAALAQDSTLLQDEAALLAVPGVGPWTVAYTRLRVRRDPDVFLATDLAVRRQLEAMGAAADPRSAASISRRWAPYRSTAMLHLWAEYLSRRARRPA
jgi:AraC family transcriptional regulator, regulatory protein of adaptative response / DNA-3-methyladenine glycosylase II